MPRVSGKTALVTGGAGGIGAATSRLLAAEGARTIIADTNRAAGQALADELQRAGQDTDFHVLDVAEESSWRMLMEMFQTEDLHILVNNAGAAFPNGDIERQSLEDWRAIMRVNSDGTFLGVKFGIEAMRRHGQGGSIINLSSILGLVGSPTTCAYTASKGAVRLLTKSAALHCAKAGYRIRVNSVHPGYIATPMVDAVLKTRDDPAALLAMVEALTPLGHLGAPEDIAHGVLYLASDESKFVTGAELVIDGGYTAQ